MIFLLIVSLLTFNGLTLEINTFSYHQKIDGQRNQTNQLHLKSKNLAETQANKYIFTKKVTLNGSFPFITGLHAQQQGKILVEGKNQKGQSKIRLITGQQYEIKQNELTIPPQAKRVKYLNQKILINTGDSIEQKIANQAFQFIYEPKWYNPAMLVTQKYILLNEVLACDKLIRIWLDSFEIQTIQFYSPYCTYSFNTQYMRDLQNGKIAYGGELSFVILDKESLQILQKIDVPRGWYEDIKFTNIDSFYDKQTNASLIKLGTWFGMYPWKQFIYQYSESEKKYKLLNQVFNQHYFKLIGVNQAISLYKDTAYHWRNINFLKDVSFDSFSFLLKQRNYVLVSNQEDFFVVSYSQNDDFSLQIYKLNDAYDPQFLFKFNSTPSHITKISSNDKLLFTLSLNSEKIRTLRIYDVSTQSYVQIQPNQNQYFLNFEIFNIEHDRLIILTKKTDQSLQNLKYWIQIRKISQPTVTLKQIQLTDFPIIEEGNMDFKIISNNEWGLKFFLYCLQNSVGVLYNIENDVLTKQVQTQSNFVSSGIFASSKYLIHLDGNDSSIKVYSNDKLQLIQKMQASLSSWKYNKSDSYILKDDQLFVRNSATSSQYATIYDFSRQRENWFNGQLQTVYLSCSTLFFPRRKIVYYYTNDGTVWQPYDPKKAVFDTNFPQDKQYQTADSSMSNDIGYYLYLQKQSKDECDRVLMLDNSLKSSDLTIWKNFPPYSFGQVYPGLTKELIFGKNHFISFDKSHHIGLYRTIDSYNIQIRKISDDFKIVQNLTYPRNISLGTVDLTKDQRIILLSYNQLQVLSINNKKQSYSFNLKSIQTFDSNDNLDYLLAGQNRDSTQQNPFYSIILVDNSSKILYQKNITGLFSFSLVALSKSSQKIAYSYKTQSTTTNLLIVQDLLNNKVILNNSFQGIFVTQITFLQQNQLLLNVDQKISIISLEKTFENSNKNMIKQSNFPLASIYSISPDGNLLAFVTGDFTVDVYDRFQKQLTHIKLQQNQASISSLTFTANNSLLIVNNQSVLYTFNQETCPFGFQNVDSYCVCTRNFADPTTCQCNKNFKDQNGSACSCLDPFILHGELCECRDNQTQIDETCQCKQNFSPRGLVCLCQKPFVFSLDGLCGCPQNSTQYESECLCNKNFVDVEGQCVCTEGFVYVLESCQCPVGRYIEQKQCIQCGIWCNQCSGGGFECSVFSWVFYCMIIVGAIVIIVAIFLITKLIRKKKLNSESNLLINKSENNIQSKDVIESPQQNREKLI